MHIRRLTGGPSLRLVGVLVAAGAMTLAFVIPAQAAQVSSRASAHRAITVCKGGRLHGTYRNLVVRGTCTVPKKAKVVINGNLTVTGRHAVFMSEFSKGSKVTVNGDVNVRRHGLLAMGTLNEGKGCSSKTTVNGSIVAVRSLSVKLDCSTVNGDLVSSGGGFHGLDSSCSPDVGNNFVVKDNQINGTVVLQGWTGCWMGVIRNQVGHSVVYVGNTPKNPDANEIVTNTIGGDLMCYRNTPPPQVGDSAGATNTVAKMKLGQCSTL